MSLRRLQTIAVSRAIIALALAGAASLLSPAAAAPSTDQPSLPSSSAGTSQSVPVVDTIVGTQRPLEVRKAGKRAGVAHRSRVARHPARSRPFEGERPALAGVLLVSPIPPRVEAPRPVVPTPSYFVDSIPAAFIIPPPPVVCHGRPRDPSLPDPRLYREVPVACEYDID